MVSCGCSRSRYVCFHYRSHQLIGVTDTMLLISYCSFTLALRNRVSPRPIFPRGRKIHDVFVIKREKTSTLTDNVLDISHSSLISMTFSVAYRFENFSKKHKTRRLTIYNNTCYFNMRILKIFHRVKHKFFSLEHSVFKLVCKLKVVRFEKIH